MELSRETPAEWCAFYGVTVVDGIALLYKTVNSGYGSDRRNPYTGNRVYYRPGSIPFAEDWDGGAKECGGGLHFAPTIDIACSFCTPYHILVCPVKLEDMAVHPYGLYPQKCKAPGCCEPIWEVDMHGDPETKANYDIMDAFFKRHPLTQTQG